ncbi:hypothetical protein HN011_007425 [Eciton burchellii]|nr:hypothetical protein HN011_007425 [Eciton burchellii]
MPAFLAIPDARPRKGPGKGNRNGLPRGENRSISSRCHRASSAPLLLAIGGRMSHSDRLLRGRNCETLHVSRGYERRSQYGGDHQTSPYRVSALDNRQSPPSSPSPALPCFRRLGSHLAIVTDESTYSAKAHQLALAAESL